MTIENTLNSVNEHFIFICHGALLFRRHFQVGIIVLVQSRANRTRVGQTLDIDKDWPKLWTFTKVGQTLDIDKAWTNFRHCPVIAARIYSWTISKIYPILKKLDK